MMAVLRISQPDRSRWLPRHHLKYSTAASSAMIECNQDRTTEKAKEGFLHAPVECPKRESSCRAGKRLSWLA
jgi:hypothetical protein